ncbi:MAG: response regulator [Anaerolineae bacterium]|nr:response regulator [Anaerolineae bacterium]
MSDGGRPRALVVEDNPAWQQIVTEILHDSGLDVDLAGGLDEASFLLRHTSHRLAVVDLALGADSATNQDGLQVLEAVRRHDPTCVAIVLTGYATVELAVEVLTEYGAFNCLRKANFDREEFGQLVNRALSAAQAHEVVDREAGTSAPTAIAGRARGAVPHVASDAVLVIEDDAGWRGILSELLTDAGYQVRLCNSYGEAVGCLRREQYRIAIVDLSLNEVAWDTDPERPLGGYQLLQHAQAHNVPAIVVSGVANRDEIERAYGDYEVFAYLEKQAFDRRAFLQSVEEAYAATLGAQSLDVLTPRELEVLAFLAQGMTNKELADELYISINTVKRHLKAIFGKLDVHTRAAAVAKAVSAGLVADTVSR